MFFTHDPIASPGNAAQDRRRGVLIGLAAGDRNGGPIRFALQLAHSLAELRRFDPHDVARRYLAWWRSGAFDTGPVAARALMLLDKGVSLDEVSRKVHDQLGGVSGGCGPAHRSAPLAAAQFIGDESLSEAARAEARITHWDPVAGDVAAAVTMLCRTLIPGTPWDAALDHVARNSPISDQWQTGTRPISTGGFAPDALRAAIHFLNESESFEVAIGRSLAFAGAANYCPVLVGAIGGAMGRVGDQSSNGQALRHHRRNP